MSKKEFVIEKARELFSKYGYRISMDELAKEAKVTKKTIYTYFKDKDELVKYFLYEELNNINKICDEINNENIPFSSKIHQMMIATLDYQGNSKLLSAFEKENRYTNNCLEIFTDEVVKSIKTKLDCAIKDGYLKKCDTSVTAFIIYKIYVALKFEWKGKLDKKALSKQLTSVLTEGIIRQGDD